VSLDLPLGRVKLGHVALGGTKVQANASVHKAMSYARMREAEKKLAAEVSAWFARAEATDAADDREHGAERRGDEMPDWVANKAARLERIRAAKVALEAEAKALPPDGDEGPRPSSGMMERTSRPQRATMPRLPWTVPIRSLSLARADQPGPTRGASSHATSARHERISDLSPTSNGRMSQRTA
jgi:hypothetical protein